MKKNFILALLLLFFASSLIAQTTVFGNLGVENVNISIVNTPYGTSTDAKGHYELPIYDRAEAVIAADNDQIVLFAPDALAVNEAAVHGACENIVLHAFPCVVTEPLRFLPAVGVEDLAGGRAAHIHLTPRRRTLP